MPERIGPDGRVLQSLDEAAAIAVALYLSKKLVRPLLALAAGTQAVSVGDYRALPEPPTNDEVGQLTRSFNTMTRQLDEARRMVETNRSQLQRSNVYLESVLANLSAGVLVFDERFCLTTFNQGAQSILKVDLRTAPGRLLQTVEGMSEFSQRIRQAFSEHTAMGSERTHWQEQFELTLQEPGPEAKAFTLTLLARGTQLNVDGRENGYMVVFDDITEVISASRSVAWGEVARRLAHEIKNPLTPMRLTVQSFQRKFDPNDPDLKQKLNDYSKTLIQQIDTMSSVASAFSNFASMPAQQNETLNVVNVVELTLDIFNEDYIVFESEEKKIISKMDRAQLIRVITNLVKNAIQSIPENQTEKTILVSVKKEENNVLILVKDNGIGIPKKVVDKIFQPFFTSKPTGEGTGLGLSLSYDIVKAHGGELKVETKEGEGSEFIIQLTT